MLSTRSEEELDWIKRDRYQERETGLQVISYEEEELNSRGERI